LFFSINKLYCSKFVGLCLTRIRFIFTLGIHFCLGFRGSRWL